MYVVPPMVIQIIKHAAEYRYDLSSLEMVNSGGAPLGGDVAEQLKTVLGVQDIRQGESAIILFGLGYRWRIFIFTSAWIC